MLHFGDSSYEKTMFGLPDELTNNKTDSVTPVLYENVQTGATSNFGVVTVNTNSNANDYFEDDKKESADNENIKGILKNKPVKPKPYHLGETVPFSEANLDEENKSWGVRLKHVENDETPIWKSTVTVHNYYDNQTSKDDDGQQEFQKLLKNLRPTKKSDYNQ
ncbi:hypothetical protein NQ317_002840 [Molorchus minor]|uniref:Uncharacterized protein n=1 Tax=Molorchus minor TaxID=1323400 RepID=A0ABQ9JVK4_9CUCU|nr:hypothetical protein NQ317_002840 [Molorchus minor]